MDKTELRFGFGKDLEHYRTRSVENENFDIEVRLPNGEVVELNARETGYALRLTRFAYALRLKRNSARIKAGLIPRETLREVDY